MDYRAWEILGVSETASVSEVRSAYRALAKRWHPDRFLAGPERDWAGVKMAEINEAYAYCLKAAETGAVPEEEALEAARRLMDEGRLADARKTLMRLSTRTAEWNYLFGTLLLKMNDREKAVLYLSVAAHQRPENAKYARAAHLAEGMRVSKGAFRRVLEATLTGGVFFR